MCPIVPMCLINLFLLGYLNTKFLNFPPNQVRLHHAHRIKTAQRRHHHFHRHVWPGQSGRGHQSVAGIPKFQPFRTATATRHEAHGKRRESIRPDARHFTLARTNRRKNRTDVRRKSES